MGGMMVRMYADLELSGDQKRRIKALCERNNYRGFVSIVSDYVWIIVISTIPCDRASLTIGRRRS
ncbi:fatty acid desaturase family protein [Pandoraea bronchicola]|uniref:Fatty acid desaturase family protein n=1 Tax=Pandoraea bronchicola TaxID=2508287 RepID=A0A5E5BNT8_9BURK|nr:fatty acid desaturase family protein [Pandoraea bronchicola]